MTPALTITRPHSSMAPLPPIPATIRPINRNLLQKIFGLGDKKP